MSTPHVAMCPYSQLIAHSNAFIKEEITLKRAKFLKRKIGATMQIIYGEIVVSSIRLINSKVPQPRIFTVMKCYSKSKSLSVTSLLYMIS